MLKSIIVAKSQNNVIGWNKKLPWHLPNDLKNFRRLTMGHYVIMGRKTFCSIDSTLPGRKVIVVTRLKTDHIPNACHTTHTIEKALGIAEQAGETEVFIAGGGEIYQAIIPFANKIYLTEVKETLQGDTFFPFIDPNVWQLVKQEEHLPDTQHTYAYTFKELTKRKAKN